MGTLKGFPNPPAMLRGEQSSPAPHAVISASGRALAASGGSGKPARAARGTNARTGRLSPAFAELVKAHKRGDQAALARVADRMGLVRLKEAIASREPGAGDAALAALPLAHGGLLLIGAATDQVAVADWPRAAAAAAALGMLLDGAVPTALEEWDVPPDVVSRAGPALRTPAWRPDAPAATRLTARQEVAA